MGKKIMYAILSDPPFANTAVTGKENIWLLLFNYFQAIGICNIHNSSNERLLKLLFLCRHKLICGNF